MCAKYVPLSLIKQPCSCYYYYNAIILSRNPFSTKILWKVSSSCLAALDAALVKPVDRNEIRYPVFYGPVDNAVPLHRENINRVHARAGKWGTLASRTKPISYIPPVETRPPLENRETFSSARAITRQRIAKKEGDEREKGENRKGNFDSTESWSILFRRKLFKNCFGRETFDVRLYRCSNSTRDFTIAHRSEKVKERSLLRSLKIRLLLLAPISTFT